MWAHYIELTYTEWFGGGFNKPVRQTFSPGSNDFVKKHVEQLIKDSPGKYTDLKLKEIKEEVLFSYKVYK